MRSVKTLVLQSQSRLQSVTFGGSQIDLTPFYHVPALAPFFTAPPNLSAVEVNLLLRLLSPRLNQSHPLSLWKRIRFLPTTSNAEAIDIYPSDVLKPSVTELQLMQSAALSLAHRASHPTHLFYAVTAYLLGQHPTLRYLALGPDELEEHMSEMLKTQRTIETLSVLVDYDVGVVPLFDGNASESLLGVMQFNRSIRTLNLNFFGNALGDAEALRLADALQVLSRPFSSCTFSNRLNSPSFSSVVCHTEQHQPHSAVAARQQYQGARRRSAYGLIAALATAVSDRSQPERFGCAQYCACGSGWCRSANGH